MKGFGRRIIGAWPLGLHCVPFEGQRKQGLGFRVIFIGLHTRGDGVFPKKQGP